MISWLRRKDLWSEPFDQLRLLAATDAVTPEAHRCADGIIDAVAANPARVRPTPDGGVNFTLGAGHYEATVHVSPAGAWTVLLDHPADQPDIRSYDSRHNHKEETITAKRGNPNPGPGQDIRTYTVDQLLAQAREPGTHPQQMHGEIERRARVLDGEQAEDD